MIITIDGPMGTGKSTIAKKLAEKLGFAYFDTGAMYRCLTYGIIKHKIDINDFEALQNFLREFHFDVITKNGDKHYFFESEDITDKIRQEEVTSLVSPISTNLQVRKKLVSIQQKFAKADTVFEGRDMGTVVFPEAELKIYLTATPEVRAKRRFDELKGKFKNSDDLTFEKILSHLKERDHRDSTRKHSPLRPAEDAHIIDTSDMTIEEVILQILGLGLDKFGYDK